jgi:tRNA(adenine34) deaminase
MFKNQFMKLAIKMAEKAFVSEEVPVGAVIINPQTKQMISEAHNLVEQKKDPTSHAEILAIQSACKALKSKNLSGLDLYVTLQPCPMCLQAILYARIKRVYFGAYDVMATDNIISLNNKIEIYGGVDEEECKNLLDKFFKEKRSPTIL